MKKTLFLLAFLAFLTFSTAAQKLPTTNILLVELGEKSVSKPQFLTAWNRSGYNNQPAWQGENALFFTCQTPADTTQSDIWQLDFSKKTRSRITATVEQEYSPTPMPDGKKLSSVLIEKDGKTQRLWSYPIDRSQKGELLFSKILAVGYHVWLSEKLAALFLVGENGAPHRLVTANLGDQKMAPVASGVGRSLHKTTDGKLLFVQKSTETTWFIKRFDPKTSKSEIMAKTLDGSEDFSVLPAGEVLMAKNAKLFQRKLGEGNDWRELADFSKYGVKTITRLAVSPSGQKLALVIQ